MPHDLKCEECGNVFQSKNKPRRFCSTKCVALHREQHRSAESRVYSRQRKHEDKPCRICGKTFKPRTARATFCSQECALIGKRRPPRVKTAARDCEVCGDNFLPNHAKQRFCSQQCSGRAMLPRMDDNERRCKVEGCEKFRVRTDPGYCAKHDYRYRFYGDPLAETSRRKRDNGPIDLDVDWESVEVAYWTKNPTHCPSGHEYTEENTQWRNTRDGPRRRLCRTCQREASKRWLRGEKRDRTATCLTCGKKWEASKFGTLPRFCEECKISRHRAKSRALQAKNRGQTPKGPTYTCQVCGMVSATPANAGMPPKLCDVCAAQSNLESKRRIWTKKNLDRYSLTMERFNALIESQCNRCAVCGTSHPGGAGSRWHIDHDHSCCGPGVSCGNCVRGLICSRCNTALGLFDDRPEILEVAIRYLKDPPAPHVP